MKEALIFLAAAVICVPIAKRFGLGAVLGYLIAGAIIGPWGLRLIANVESTLHLAELGVVLLLFVIGLELDPRRLAATRHAVFVGGGIQIGLCGLVLSIGLYAIGIPPVAAAIVGITLALSSTAIAISTMQERNELATPTGQSIFGILLFQDIAALPLIALVPLVSHTPHPSGMSAWERAGIAFVAIAGVIVLGRYLLRPLLRLIARVNLREVFTAFSLLLVIGIALFVQWAGLSPALGGFLAGVLLASSEFRHALESDIEPFKGLLLGLFFIAVGMTIDFGLLMSDPRLVAMLVAGFLALKVGALYVVARLLGITTRQRLLFAILLSQGGEFAFVVFGVAKVARVLSPEWEDLLTIVVALSMAATPLLLVIHDKLIARKVRTEREDDTIDQQAPIIIAGFGRFGQIVGRLLFANGMRAVVLDHDPDQIELLRNFGFPVYYGDASRLDLLRAAGAADAKLLVNAIDNVEDSLALVDRVRANFPNLRIIARARNVSHYFELRLRGVEVVERELFEGSLRTGRRALEAMGVDPFRARDMANAFRQHNVQLMDNMLPHYRDQQRLMSLAKSGREELEEQFRRDREKFEKEHPESWR
ncbi:Glutathione-regulated potassium-efflux system protein KefC [Usitatibacter rugosus]|uniref:Glutathione-regulated potassium-efflux system protein KefC n=1 Tax=Usitatibacter rugosus TaxID=2732067 RepID=A0A6M4GPR5_9PROT|nr:glutathione-regulated potassium-efflux system protein KefC [Usitatibacter rugosus]QJR09066.1 Glutathione-regulated potassium-efflux system protein KefC [Usitatibacter rugosus]